MNDRRAAFDVQCRPRATSRPNATRRWRPASTVSPAATHSLTAPMNISISPVEMLGRTRFEHEAIRALCGSQATSPASMPPVTISDAVRRERRARNRPSADAARRLRPAALRRLRSARTSSSPESTPASSTCCSRERSSSRLRSMRREHPRLVEHDERVVRRDSRAPSRARRRPAPATVRARRRRSPDTRAAPKRRPARRLPRASTRSR